MATKLGCSDEKRKQIQQVQDERVRKSIEEPREVHYRQKMQKHRDETHLKIQSVLTDEQKQMLIGLKGKPGGNQLRSLRARSKWPESFTYALNWPFGCPIFAIGLSVCRSGEPVEIADLVHDQHFPSLGVDLD